MSSTADLEAVFEASRNQIWGLCYRMTGCAADADDLLQETFARAISRPPVDSSKAWGPWLVRVAMNLSRDHLRWRRRRYPGPFLPAPLREEEGASFEAGSAARVDQKESVTMAFLVALEALTPQQRAVLLLRDVLDYSIEETAGALDLSRPNVKTTLHRARRALAKADRREPLEKRDLEKDSMALESTLARFVQALSAGDASGFAALLAEDVRSLSDGAGQYRAALRPVSGRERVSAFYLGLARKELPTGIALRRLSHAPSLILEFARRNPRDAPRAVISLVLGSDGRIVEIYSVLADRKLCRVESSYEREGSRRAP